MDWKQTILYSAIPSTFSALVADISSHTPPFPFTHLTVTTVKQRLFVTSQENCTILQFKFSAFCVLFTKGWLTSRVPTMRCLFLEKDAAMGVIQKGNAISFSVGMRKVGIDEALPKGPPILCHLGGGRMLPLTF